MNKSKMLVVLLTMAGCAPTAQPSVMNSASWQAARARHHHVQRCQEMAVDMDIVSMRRWCVDPSTPAQRRQYICETVTSYTNECHDIEISTPSAAAATH